MNTVDTRVPPNNPVAERHLLGGIIADASSLPECMAIIPGPEAFWLEAHAELYRVILSLSSGRAQIDIPALEAATLANPRIVEAGGGPWIGRIVSESPKAATLAYHARIVLEAFQRRRLELAGRRLVDNAHDDTLETEAAASRAADDISAAVLSGKAGSIVPVAEAFERVMAQLEAGKPAFLKSGLGMFDAGFGGLPRGGVVTVMGTPSSGKTTLCVQIMRHLAMNGEQALIISNEQNAARIGATLLTMQTGMPIHKMIGDGDATPSQVEVIRKAVGDLKDLRIELVEESLHGAQIYNQAKLAATRGATVVMVDYLQDLPCVPGFTNGEERVGENMRNLKRIPRELGMTTVIVSQLDKATGKENRRPTMFDGMYSSRIEQASDMMIGVWREFMNENPPTDGGHAADDWKERQRATEFLILKNKYGPRGNIGLRFDPSALTFEERYG